MADHGSVVSRRESYEMKQCNSFETHSNTSHGRCTSPVPHKPRARPAPRDEPTKEQIEAFKHQVMRFVEVSKHFSSPLKKSASYMCESQLVAFPKTVCIRHKRGGSSTHYIKFSNLTLGPVDVKLYKVLPILEQLKFVNLSFSRSKRIPPGLSYSLAFLYEDNVEKPVKAAKMIFVACRKTTTPCYQVCEIDLNFEVKKPAV